MACPVCGYSGDLGRHWARFPTCAPAFVCDMESSAVDRQPPPPTTSGGTLTDEDIDVASLFVQQQTVKRLGKLILKDKMKPKNVTEVRALLLERNEFALNAHAQKTGTDNTGLQNRSARGRDHTLPNY